MQFSLVILACLATAFGASTEETTWAPAPTPYINDGNDQEPTTAFLDEELGTETFENSKIDGDDEGLAIFDESENEDEEKMENEADTNPEDESDQIKGEIEDEGTIVKSEQEDDIGNKATTSIPVEDAENLNNDVGNAVPPSNPSADKDEENENGDSSPGELSFEGGESESGAGDDLSDQNPDLQKDEEKYKGEPNNQEEGEVGSSTSSGNANSGFDGTAEVPAPNEIDAPTSDFAPTPTKIEPTYIAPTPNDSMAAPTHSFTPYPEVYKPPTLRPASAYVSTDDDPLKEDDYDRDSGDWTWNDSTIEEMEHDKTVIIGLSVVFGLMFFFSIFVAFQMLENPDGCCASICRITVTCFCGITRCICYPCRAMCGCTSPSSRQHMIVPEDGNFTHDLELS